MYEWLVFVHIATAMIWVGGGFVVIAAHRKAFRTGGVAAADRSIRDFEWMDNWVFTPAPLLVVASGIAMVVISEAWSFSQLWIYAALILIAVEMISGTRDVKRMTEARKAGVASSEYSSSVSGFLRFAPLALGLLGLVVILMVFKPVV